MRFSLSLKVPVNVTEELKSPKPEMKAALAHSHPQSIVSVSVFIFLCQWSVGQGLFPHDNNMYLAVISWLMLRKSQPSCLRYKRAKIREYFCLM